MKVTTPAIAAALLTLSTGCATTCPPCAEAPAQAAPAAKPAATPAAPAAPSPATISMLEQVTWEDLNPARGDQSPRAGTLWGDRKGKVATGYLLKPVDGFRSPPHIHNVTYRAVVIRGVLHNDDAAAEEMWMPAGSFWTQPKGAPHITSAKGTDTLAYIEIDEGPYLVHPVKDAFETPERPVNVHVSNIVWVPTDRASSKVEIAYLWGKPYSGTTHGVFVRLQPGAKGALAHEGDALHAVVIAGKPTLQLPAKPAPAALAPGAHFQSKGPAHHPLGCEGAEACVVYVRASGVLKAVAR